MADEQIKLLFVKSEKHKIGEAELTFTALSLEDAYLFQEEKNMNIPLIVSKSIGVSEEDAKKISFEYITEIFEVIRKINKLPGMDKSKLEVLYGKSA